MNPDVIASAYRLKLREGQRLLEDRTAQVRAEIPRIGDGYAYELARKCVADLVPSLLGFCERSMEPLVLVHLQEGERDVAAIVDRLQREFVDKLLSELPGGYLYLSVRGGAAGLAAQSRQNDEQLFLARKATLRDSVGDYVNVVIAEGRSQAQGSPAPVRPKDQKFGILDSPALWKEDLKNPPGVLGRAVVYFDIDHFKAQNTRFTERVVDEFILPQLQKIVVRHVQSIGYAYAEGGDEMVILLPNATKGIAIELTTALRRAICQHTFDVNGTTVQLSASFGVATSTERDLNLVDCANLAKQFVKENGRNGVAVREGGENIPIPLE